MSLSAFLLTLALAAPPATASRGSRLEQGVKLFNQGDFENALKQLDLAAADEREPAMLERVHLLRGQCFSARQDFLRAEEAFALALEANPDATLDPERVDPTVVKLLDAVRARLTATLVLNSSPPGATVFLDSKNAGVAPQTVQAPIGRHRLEARWDDGPMAALEVTLKPKREVRIEWVQSTLAPVPVSVQPELRPIRPFGDLRGTFEAAVGVATPAGGLELGGGVEFSFFRVGVAARLFPFFGVVPRASLVVPLLAQLNVFLEVQVPVWLTRPSGGLGVGLGAAAGAEYLLRPWVGAYGQVGFQHLLINLMRNDNTAFVASAGARLRLP